jgi:hypothetical protein
VLVFAASAGETNQVELTRVGDQVTIVDTGGTAITAESGCT